MDLEKIGKFIAECRKEKHLTQEQLAEKLGITYKAVSKWECGKGLPDVSLFKELCDILGITLNDLFAGEKIEEDNYKAKVEENIINTIDYSTEKIKKNNNKMGYILIVIGLLMSISALVIFKSESSWGSIYSIIGVIISLIGICKFTKKFSYPKRVFYNLGYFILAIIFLIIVDFVGVISIHQAPRFTYKTLTGENMIIYNAAFYKVYRINYDTPNEYYIIDTKNEFDENTVPISPFNRDKSGINNIIKYKNKYVGNNSNDVNLINQLPLSEYKHDIEIDSEKLGLTINYYIRNYYINENFYLEKSLLYNSASIFTLIDNVDYITYKFSDNSYTITRSDFTKNYPNYKELNQDLKNNFDKYVESKMNDYDFVNNTFKMFLNK